ncbi:MAG: Rne/Rng family ribonuclease [Candidatus Fonsibacter sp.]
MSKELLIDGSHPEETRIAIKSNDKVEEYEYENIHHKNLKGNIYLGKISRIEPSLQAAFVDFGNERHGFLAFNDIQTDYYQIPQADKDKIKKEEEERREKLIEENVNDLDENLNEKINRFENNDDDFESDINKNTENNNNNGNELTEEASVNSEIEKNNFKKFPRYKRYRIQEVIKPGQIVLIQIVKEERGRKGAALTTYISLPGKYIVLMPNTSRGGGISRKIFNSGDRQRIKDLITDLNLPKTMGMIVRTAGASKTKNEIKTDLDILLLIWEEIRNKTLGSIAPSLIYEDQELIGRSIRDFYSKDITSIVVDGDKAFELAKKYARQISVEHENNVKKYKGKIPIFHHYNIEKYLNIIFESRIDLRSGGYIIINPTEALVSIDVNSGRSTRERFIEKTALTNNLEAAEEIARQIKLRDLAGLIVIDFIDMENYSNKRMVERRLREFLRSDKAKIQFGRISNFGLLEMTRQRLREGSLKWETLLTPQSFALKIIKIFEEKAFTETKIKTIEIQLAKKIIDIIEENHSKEVSFFKNKYKFKINFKENVNFLNQDYSINFYDSKKKIIDEIKNIQLPSKGLLNNNSKISDTKKVKKTYKKKMSKKIYSERKKITETKIEA